MLAMFMGSLAPCVNPQMNGFGNKSGGQQPQGQIGPVCGADQSKHSWIPYNDFINQLNLIYAKLPQEDCTGNGPAPQHFCLAGSKQNIVKDLESTRDQLVASHQAMCEYKQFDQFKQLIERDFGV